MKTRKSIFIRLTGASAILSIALIACVAIGLWEGAVDISIGQVIEEYRQRASGNWTEASIFWDLRLPRVLLALVVGAVLAAGGAALQGLLGNPLAEPYTVGVSSGCLLGASLAAAFLSGGPFGVYSLPAAAFVTGIIAVSLVFALARRAGSLDVNAFLLSGIIIGAFFWALTTFILSARREDLARIFMWLAGSLNTAYPWEYLAMASQAGVICILGLMYLGRDLNAYSLGEESARQLGIDPEILKTAVIALVTLGTAACVSAVGVIGFVGLIVPQGMRRVFGSDHRLLIITSALGGGCLVVLADTLARSLAPPREIPLGVITAVIGAPVFLYILNRSRR